MRFGISNLSADAARYAMKIAGAYLDSALGISNRSRTIIESIDNATAQAGEGVKNGVKSGFDGSLKMFQNFKSDSNPLVSTVGGLMSHMLSSSAAGADVGALAREVSSRALNDQPAFIRNVLYPISVLSSTAIFSIGQLAGDAASNIASGNNIGDNLVTLGALVVAPLGMKGLLPNGPSSPVMAELAGANGEAMAIAIAVPAATKSVAAPLSLWGERGPRLTVMMNQGQGDSNSEGGRTQTTTTTVEPSAPLPTPPTGLVEEVPFFDFVGRWLAAQHPGSSDTVSQLSGWMRQQLRSKITNQFSSLTAFTISSAKDIVINGPCITAKIAIKVEGTSFPTVFVRVVIGIDRNTLTILVLKISSF